MMFVVQLSYELQELSSVAQTFREMILGLWTLLLVRFGTLVNPVTNLVSCFDVGLSCSF